MRNIFKLPFKQLLILSTLITIVGCTSDHSQRPELNFNCNSRLIEMDKAPIQQQQKKETNYREALKKSI